MLNNLKELKAMMDALGLDKASLEKLARHLMKDPNLRKQFEEQMSNESFRQFVEEGYKELDEAFKHFNSPGDESSS